MSLVSLEAKYKWEGFDFSVEVTPITVFSSPAQNAVALV